MFSTIRLGRLWPVKTGVPVPSFESAVSVGDEVIDHVQGGSRWVVERYVRSREARPRHVVLRYAGQNGRRRLVSERQLCDSHFFAKAGAAETYKELI